MSGKAILILAVSFSAIFIVFGRSFFSVSNKATIDMVESLNEEKALEIAKSATNIVVSYFWQKPDSRKTLWNQFQNPQLRGLILSDIPLSALCSHMPHDRSRVIFSFDFYLLLNKKIIIKDKNLLI